MNTTAVLSNNSAKCFLDTSVTVKMNTTTAVSSNNSAKCFPDTSVTAVLFPCLYGLLFVFGLALNVMAAWIFFTMPSKSTLVVYLKNVVVADTLMTLTVPVRMMSDAGVGSWPLRVFHCRCSAVLYYLTMYVGVLFLGLIGLDRYLKMVRSSSPLRRVRVAQVLSACVWAVMIAVQLPNSVLSDKPPDVSSGRKVKCASLKSDLGLAWHEACTNVNQVVFWGTLALMVLCYSLISRTVYQSYKRSRGSSEASRRTNTNVFVVVAVFFVCFAPYHFVRVPYTLSQTRNQAQHCRAENALYFAKSATLWLSATNVCLDPLIYVLLCEGFRKRLAAAFSCKPLLLPQSTGTASSTELQGMCDRKE